MNKETFLTKLRKRLNILEDSEIEDIISEYEGHIDEKVNSGLTEEEAVKELGDFEEIVRDLLSAYKIKGANKDDNFFNSFINKMGSLIDRFIESLNNKSGRDILRILIEIVLILFLICLLKIPFVMIEDLGSSIFSELINPIGRIFRSVWVFITQISYIIVSVIVFIKMIENRVFKNVSENITNLKDDDETPKKTKKEKNTKDEEKPKEVVNTNKTNHSIGNILIDICIYILKFIVLMIAMGIVFYLIGMSVAVGFSIYLLINGVHYFGIYLLLLVLLLGGILLLELCINFISNRRTKALPFFIKLIVLVILMGLSLTISSLEIASTEIIYNGRTKDTKTVTKEINMTKNLGLHNYDRVVINNDLKDKVVIEYNYPDYDDNVDIDILLNPCGTDYCLDINVNHASWNKKIIENIIENLKYKKIYTYDFYLEKVIYISEENYNIVKNNSGHYNYFDDYDYTFEHTYNILNVTDKNDENYIYLTIEDDDVKTIKVPRILNNSIPEKGTYNFTFECSDDYGDIKELFNACKIINAEKVSIEE